MPIPGLFSGIGSVFNFGSTLLNKGTARKQQAFGYLNFVNQEDNYEDLQEYETAKQKRQIMLAVTVLVFILVISISIVIIKKKK